MNPTLKAGDGLQLKPYRGKKIRSGDVVVFNSPDGDRKITHRVVSVDSKGIRTWGDNNKNIDPWVVSPEHIIGRVIYAQRGKKWKRVFGGVAGQLFAIVVRVIKVLDSGTALMLRPAYRWMVRTGFLRELFKNQIKSAVVTINRPGGAEMQLLMGRRVIGRLRSGKAQWQIRRPFRLFLDEASLPKGT
jgi:signal peptidase I